MLLSDGAWEHGAGKQGEGGGISGESGGNRALPYDVQGVPEPGFVVKSVVKRRNIFTAGGTDDYNEIDLSYPHCYEDVAGAFMREREDKNMDIKEQIKKAVERISKDKDLQEKFQKDPIKAVEGILGVDLPEDVINQVVQGVKAKLTADNVSGAVDALKGFLKK